MNINHNQLNEPNRNYSISELSDMTGISRKTVKSKLEALGIPHTVGPKNSKIYNLSDIVKIVLSVDSVVPKQTNNIDAEKLLLTIAKREREELLVKKMQNELVPLADITKALADEYAAVRSQLLTLGASIGREMSLLNNPEDCASLITDKMNEILIRLGTDESE